MAPRVFFGGPSEQSEDALYTIDVRYSTVSGVADADSSYTNSYRIYIRYFYRCTANTHGDHNRPDIAYVAIQNSQEALQVSL